MMKTAITIGKLSKQYKLVGTEPYLSLRDLLVKRMRSIGKKSSQPEVFWALKDIDLEIKEGERIGVIGHNGAGKSTLLKIISQITPPTKGRIELNGRVASLLEVGTGFHPELTGRENIYLNGSILGLKKVEIDRKLAEIIEFSGVERFIDMPLKHFSSGMQLRLAFAVAAHLEPEILLIDEVLAVGDMEFQKKCIGKMEQISKESGRTILFVSHNMAAIKQLCTGAVVLNKGVKTYSGKVEDALNFYNQQVKFRVPKAINGVIDLTAHPNKINSDEGLLTAEMFVNDSATYTFIPGSDLRLELTYFIKSDLLDPDIGIHIKDEQHNTLIALNNKELGKKISLVSNTKGYATILLPKLNIYKPGKYSLNLYFGDPYHYREHLYNALEFTVLEEDVYNADKLLNPELNQIFVPGIEIIAKH